MSIVVDTSVTMTWLFAEQATPMTEQTLIQIQNSGAFVPAIWSVEVLNVLLVAERRGRLIAAQSLRFLSDLIRLEIEVEPVDWPARSERTLALAREYQLTSYDASYLELSIRRGLPLATLDEPLRTAALKSGVPLA